MMEKHEIIQGERERIKDLFNTKLEEMFDRRLNGLRHVSGKAVNVVPLSQIKHFKGIFLTYLDNPDYKRTTNYRKRKKKK